MEENMTDKQMSIMLKMLLKIIKHCTTVDEAVQEIEDLIEADE